MGNIEHLVNNGFSISCRGGRLIDLSLLSLRIALESYFSTYQSMKYSLHIFDDKNDFEQDEIDYQHRQSYFKACIEAIVHFQHFAELFIKEALRKEHPLLANEASSKPLILYKLLKKEAITSSEMDKINSIEFSDALSRFLSLLKEKKIKDKKLEFIKKYKEPLEKLNILRNRMWHRGTFILRYPTLDEFIGNYILPFINEIFHLPKYSRLVGLWKYHDLHCKIDPIDEIIKSYQNGIPPVRKIALLKELGRAAYENPLVGGKLVRFSKHKNEEIRVRAERIAEGAAKGPNIEKVCICPVCGIKSLVVYNDIATNRDDIDEEDIPDEPYKAWRYTWQVNCMCCTFEINYHIENPSVYGLPIEDYWQSEELK